MHARRHLSGELDCPAPFLPLQLQYNSLCIIKYRYSAAVYLYIYIYIYILKNRKKTLLSLQAFFFTCEIATTMVAIFYICWLSPRLIHENESSGSQQLTGKCFHMVRIVTKNNLFWN